MPGWKFSDGPQIRDLDGPVVGKWNGLDIGVWDGGSLGNFQSDPSSEKWRDVCLELEGGVLDFLDGNIPAKEWSPVAPIGVEMFC